MRDVVIGMSDGLTVPFAAAGLSGAVASARVVVVAGLAEIAAGSNAGEMTQRAVSEACEDLPLKKDSGRRKKGQRPKR